MKTVIHINQHIIKKNKKENLRLDPITAKNYKGNHKASEILISGPCKVVYRPDKPLKCGAVCWIESHGEIVLNQKIKQSKKPKVK